MHASQRVFFLIPSLGVNPKQRSARRVGGTRVRSLVNTHAHTYAPMKYRLDAKCARGGLMTTSG